MRGEVMGKIIGSVDPNAALAELLDLARSVDVDRADVGDDRTAPRMAELFLALHEHLASGKWPPAAWEEPMGPVIPDPRMATPKRRRFYDLSEDEKQDVADGRPVPGYGAE